MFFVNWWTAHRRGVAGFILYWIAFSLLGVVDWLFRSFGPVTIPQILYYLHFSSGLILDTDNAFLVTFLMECVLAPTLGATVLVTLELYVDTAKLTRKITGTQIGTTSKLSRFITTIRRSFRAYALAVSLTFFFFQSSVFSYVTARYGPDRFSEIFVDPATVKFHAKDLKNLVLIYVESLEASYSDSAVFGKDLLKEANALPGSSFESFVSAPGTGWTMAGITATQCGIPLQFIPGTVGGDEKKSREVFLPNATCLGDVLDKFGYHNVFLGGANLRFAGKSIFLSDHHYHESYGSKEWKTAKASKEGFNEWGMYDDDLFRNAKKKLLELTRSGKLFNLTILTVDTHEPKGFYSKLCVERGALNFEGILQCTSSQLAEFFDFAAKSGVLKNTNFVIMGDHLARNNPLTDQLKSHPNRRIFNKFISAELPLKNREKIVPFDLYPTILEFLGIEVEGNKLGLGCSAFFERESPCASLALTEESYDRLATSSAYRKLWDDQL